MFFKMNNYKLDLSQSILVIFHVKRGARSAFTITKTSKATQFPRNDIIPALSLIYHL